VLPITEHVDYNVRNDYFVDPTIPPQRRIILDHIAKDFSELDEDNSFYLLKARLFIIGILSACVGAVLTLYSLAQTVLFSMYQPNMTVFYVSMIFYIPIFYWFVRVFLPCPAEYRRRKMIHANRRKRAIVEKRRYNIYHGHDEFDDLPRAGEFNFREFIREIFQTPGEIQAGSPTKQSAQNLTRSTSFVSIPANYRAEPKSYNELHNLHRSPSGVLIEKPKRSDKEKKSQQKNRPPSASKAALSKAPVSLSYLNINKTDDNIGL
jgi:hypothetical protein